MEKTDKKVLVASLVILGVILAGICVGRSQEGKQYDLWRILSGLDSAVVSLRKGGSVGISYLSSTYTSSLSVENIDNTLDNRIIQAFDIISATAKENLTEDNIFALRADVVAAASLLGVSVSPVYTFAVFIILAISVLISLLVTFLTKGMVNWDLVRDAKAKVDAFNKEKRDATMKRDTKRLHKLGERQAEINKYQGVMFSQNFKPTIIYSIPLFLLWVILGAVFSGWVVAWTPFRIDLPIVGPLVAFGFGWWYFLTYLGLSQVFRKIFIREKVRVASTAPPASPQVMK